MKGQTSNEQDIAPRKSGYAPPTLAVLGSVVAKTRGGAEGNTQEPFSESLSWSTQN